MDESGQLLQAQGAVMPSKWVRAGCHHCASCLQECLEAEFYSWAAFGHGLNSTLLGGGPGSIGGKQAVFLLEATKQ